MYFEVMNSKVFCKKCSAITGRHSHPPLNASTHSRIAQYFFAFSFADFFLILSQMEKFLFSGKRRCAKEQENN